MAEFDVSKLQKQLKSNQCTQEQAFQKCWMYLQNFIRTHPANTTVPANLIEYFEKNFEGFKKYLLDNNYAQNESQIPESLTELRMKQTEIQDEMYKKICDDLKSTIYITHLSGKKPKQRLVKEASPILFASLFIKTDDAQFSHFINIFKNCVKHRRNWPYTFDEYTIPQNLFESFNNLFPEYIEILRDLSSELYATLYDKKAPYDKQLKEVEFKIHQKVKEILQSRISYIILPSGERMKVLYDD